MSWWVAMKKEPLFSQPAGSCAWCKAWTEKRRSSMFYWSQLLTQVKQMCSLFWLSLALLDSITFLMQKKKSTFFTTWNCSAWRFVPRFQFSSPGWNLGSHDVKGNSFSWNQDFYPYALVGLTTDFRWVGLFPP